jgi:hypothetical protein
MLIGSLVLTPLETSHGRQQYRLLRPYGFRSSFNGGGLTICVPKGFVTDFASIPRGLWNLFPCDGRHSPAAVIHDFLYSGTHTSRFLADAIFREVMTELQVPRWRRDLMYFAVRLFGWRCFKKPQPT